MCRSDPQLLASLRRHRLCPISRADAASSDRPSPGPCESGSFSRVSSPLRSPFAVPPATLPNHFARMAVLPGSLPSSRRHRGCPLIREHAFSRYVPSSGFLNLSTVCATFRFCRLVSSRCHVQGFFRSGVSPVPQPSRLVAGACPRAVTSCALTGKPAATRVRFDFEALLCGAMRFRKFGFTLACDSLPSSVFVLLQVSRPSRIRFRGSSALDVSRRGLFSLLAEKALAAPAVYSVLSQGARWCSRLRVHQPARGFEPSGCCHPTRLICNFGGG